VPAALEELPPIDQVRRRGRSASSRWAWPCELGGRGGGRGAFVRCR
jgi:hypothetical protein